jgi:hypothetical protein
MHLVNNKENTTLSVCLSECVIDKFFPSKSLKVLMSHSLTCIYLMFQKDADIQAIVSVRSTERGRGSHLVLARNLSCSGEILPWGQINPSPRTQVSQSLSRSTTSQSGNRKAHVKPDVTTIDLRTYICGIYFLLNLVAVNSGTDRVVVTVL